MVAACKQPGVSIASVALAHGLNANLLRRWIVEHSSSAAEQPQIPTLMAAAQAERATGFVPVTVAPERGREESIRIELRRGATTVTVIWPVNAAADCAAWMRELLR
jgi:transposase